MLPAQSSTEERKAPIAALDDCSGLSSEGTTPALGSAAGSTAATPCSAVSSALQTPVLYMSTYEPPGRMSDEMNVERYSPSQEDDVIQAVLTADANARSPPAEHEELLQDDNEDSTPNQEDEMLPTVAPPSRPTDLGASIRRRSRGQEELEMLRRQYERSTKARPRPTTPVESCVIENFVMTTSTTSKQDGGMKIQLPGTQDSCSGGSATGRRRRKNSMSWTEFTDTMTANPFRSGRTTPMTDAMTDMFDDNPSYRDMVPQAPVLHRCSSTEWVSFTDQMTDEQPFTQSNPFTQSTAKHSVARDADQPLYGTLPRSPRRAPPPPPPRSPQPSPLPPGIPSVPAQSRILHDTTQTRIPDHHDITKPRTPDHHESASQVPTEAITHPPIPPSPHQPITILPVSSNLSQAKPPIPTQPPIVSHKIAPAPMLPQPEHIARAAPSRPPAPPSVSAEQPEITQQPYQVPQLDQTSVAPADVMKPETNTSPLAADSHYGPHDSCSVPEPVLNLTTSDNTSFYSTAEDVTSSTEAAAQPPPSVMDASIVPDVPKIGVPDPDVYMSDWNAAPSASTWEQFDEDSTNSFIPADPSPPPPLPLQSSSVIPPALPPLGAIKITLGGVGSAKRSSVDQRSPDSDTSSDSDDGNPDDPKSHRSYHPPEDADFIATANYDPDTELGLAPQAKPVVMNSDQWKEFEALTGRISEMVKETQERMQTWDKTSTAKELLEDEGEKYMTSARPPPKGAKAKAAKKEKDKEKEWRGVTDVIEESIVKEKEKSKPKRPPAPAPPRPAPPAPKVTRQPSVPMSWEEADEMERAGIEIVVAPSAPAPPSTVPEVPEEEVQEEQAADEAEKSNDEDEDAELPPPPTEEELNELEEQKEEVPPLPKWESIEHARLPSSDSGFFARAQTTGDAWQDGGNAALVDVDNLLTDVDVDPFSTKTPEQILEEAKARVAAEEAIREVEEDLALFGALSGKKSEDQHSSGESEGPDRETASVSAGFGDDFQPKLGEDEVDENDTMPLYEEDDSQPLVEFPEKCTADGWEFMLRFPIKKKFMGDRTWKPVFVKLAEANKLVLFAKRGDARPFMELELQANYSLSNVELNAYDVYGKIHTVKIQHVVYREKMGIRPGQIPKLVEGQFSRLGLPLEHAAAINPLLKFGSFNYEDVLSFVNCIEDLLFHMPAIPREGPLGGGGISAIAYKQDEIQIHVYDEYFSMVDKDGHNSDMKGRVRLFCLAFLSGDPTLEIGLNDRRRQGKEIVRRRDIMPMYTERWIRYEALEFHESVSVSSFNQDHLIQFRPMDAAFFEVMRFRVRPPRARELPLSVKAVMNIAGSKIEIRIEAMVALFKSRRSHQAPCENIQIRFPIPEAWIYLFREDRHWGVGSVHSKTRRPGKIKNIKDRLMGVVQADSNCLLEAAIGEAKYEHVFRSLVWRIPKLPEKHHGAYKSHLLRCRFELSSFDLMPDEFLPMTDVEYTMPVASVSSTVVRSVSIDEHDEPDDVEKWVRYVARYRHKVEVDYVQVTDLDIDAITDPTAVNVETEKEMPVHKPSLDPTAIAGAHDGYKIEFSENEIGKWEKERAADERPAKDTSSSDDDEDETTTKFPVVQIDMTGYGYN